jgi:hypothetical protein
MFIATLHKAFIAALYELLFSVVLVTTNGSFVGLQSRGIACQSASDLVSVTPNRDKI